ncbi:hypothetical protein HDV06_000640 [Boothiomyces sp. JEL0866]|nr:hypothetical protein HDV06_000640 [Boothiomyces sp. JEL0866]
MPKERRPSDVSGMVFNAIDDPHFAETLKDFLTLLSPEELKQEPHISAYFAEQLSRWGRWTYRGRAPALCFEAACVGGLAYLSKINKEPSELTTKVDSILARLLAGIIIDAVEPMAREQGGAVREKAVGIVADEFLARAASPRVASSAKKRMKKRKTELRVPSMVEEEGLDFTKLPKEKQKGYPKEKMQKVPGPASYYDDSGYQNSVLDSNPGVNRRRKGSIESSEDLNQQDPRLAQRLRQDSAGNAQRNRPPEPYRPQPRHGNPPPRLGHEYQDYDQYVMRNQDYDPRYDPRGNPSEFDRPRRNSRAPDIYYTNTGAEYDPNFPDGRARPRKGSLPETPGSDYRFNAPLDYSRPMSPQQRPPIDFYDPRSMEPRPVFGSRQQSLLPAQRGYNQPPPQYPYPPQQVPLRSKSPKLPNQYMPTPRPVARKRYEDDGRRPSESFDPRYNDGRRPSEGFRPIVRPFEPANPNYQMQRNDFPNRPGPMSLPKPNINFDGQAPSPLRSPFTGAPSFNQPPRHQRRPSDDTQQTMFAPSPGRPQYPGQPNYNRGHQRRPSLEELSRLPESRRPSQEAIPRSKTPNLLPRPEARSKTPTPGQRRPSNDELQYRREDDRLRASDDRSRPIENRKPSKADGINLLSTVLAECEDYMDTLDTKDNQK